MKSDGVQISNRKAAFVALKDYCVFSMGKKGDFIEVTKWSNGEGYDIHISDIRGDVNFYLTEGQFEAIKKCIKKIESE
jgi:hypothetical protein